MDLCTGLVFVWISGPPKVPCCSRTRQGEVDDEGSRISIAIARRLRRIGHAGERAGVPLGGHPPDRLPDCGGGPADGQAAIRGKRRGWGRERGGEGGRGGGGRGAQGSTRTAP